MIEMPSPNGHRTFKGGNLISNNFQKDFQATELMQKRGLDSLKISSATKSLPKTYTTNGKIKYPGSEVKVQTESTPKENSYSLYKTKPKISSENEENHNSIHEPNGFEDYGNSPLSRSGLNKKIAKEKLQSTSGKFPELQLSDTMSKIESFDITSGLATTTSKKDKINRLVESYSNKYGLRVSKNENSDYKDLSQSDSNYQNPQPSKVIIIPKEKDWNSIPLPVDSRFVLKNFESRLSSLEFREILELKEIFYISDMMHKLPAKIDQDYDDEKGDYIVIRGDQVCYRYEVVDLLGRGSFGQVLKVFDHKKKEMMALKIIKSHKKFHFQAKIEIKILNYIFENKGSDSYIVELRDNFVFRNHVCIVFDLLSTNLYDFLKANKFKGFTTDALRKVAIQVLQSLKFLKDHRIIHCDLKPENILLKSTTKTAVKLIDFGSSCFDHEKLYTYIQSRFYRSPEIILGLPYSTQIDMWSFGCLLCELSAGVPLFSGESEQDQFLSIMEVMCPPDKEMINVKKSPKKKKFFDDEGNPKVVPNSRGKIRIPGSIAIQAALKCTDMGLLDLIKKCLVYDPDIRYTPEDALNHDWIREGLQKTFSPVMKQPMESPKMLPENRRSEDTNMFTIKKQQQAHKRAYTKNTFEVTQNDFKTLNTAKTEHDPISPSTKTKFNFYKPQEESQNIPTNEFISPRKIEVKPKYTEESDPTRVNTINAFASPSNANPSMITSYSNKRRRMMTMNRYPSLKAEENSETNIENRNSLMKNLSIKPLKMSRSLEKKFAPNYQSVSTPKTSITYISGNKKEESLDPKKFYFPNLKTAK